MESILIDEADAHLLQEHKWRIQRFPHTEITYAVRSFNASGKKILLSLHRVVMGAKDGQFVDHINGNGLDCRKANLRFCTHAQNMQNRKIAKHNKLGIKGVYKHRSKYAAEIRANGKRHYLGSFDTAELASLAYQAASKELHGEFSRLI